MIFEKLVEVLEDKYDLKIAERSYKRHIENGSETIRFDDLVEELEIDL